MTRRRKIVGGAVVLALLGGGAAVGIARSQDRGPEVRVQEVLERDLVATITATGKVRARRQVNISSDVMGRVTELAVEDGDEVEAGQVLLRLDPSEFRAAMARARAALSQAQAQEKQQQAGLVQARRELERLRDLRDRSADLVSRQAVEEAETHLEIQEALLESAAHGVEQARAGVEEAEEHLAKTTIRAPISGRVIRLNIDEGETVVVGTMNNPGSLLLTIGDLSAIEAVMVVDETDIPRISPADSAVVELDAFRGRSFSARVTRIASSAIETTAGGAPQQARGSVDYEVILTLLDPPDGLRPDLSATADIIVDRRDGAVAVPIISVTVRDEAALDEEAGGVEAIPPGEGVFVLRDGTAVWTPVTLGITGQEHFEILSGLAPGDTVISGPFQAVRDLQDGASVRVVGDSGAGP